MVNLTTGSGVAISFRRSEPSASIGLVRPQRNSINYFLPLKLMVQNDHSIYQDDAVMGTRNSFLSICTKIHAVVCLLNVCGTFSVY